MEKNFKLNNNITIPSIGFGTWQTPLGQTAIDTIKSAVKAGYRHIDAAAIYKNEKSVGTGIKECGLERKDLFITSKVWNTERGYETTLKAFKKTLHDLQLDYLDLYLIHWPANAQQFTNWKAINSETWSAMEKLHKEGKVRSIGVSNFLPHHLEALLETATIKPAVNQIEYHPGFMQNDCVQFCKSHNILIEGWSPLGRGEVLKNEILIEMGRTYNKSVAQLCIRWALQNQVLPLPKSVTPQRITENFEVFDFEITASDMKIINDMDHPKGGAGLNPDTVTF
ncbi:aldo/keto reductase [Flavobacterium sp. F-380]|uniref:Aldo/keto reductase n=1 Tax=Flavobacterium kayseriense TaxID=2764714 RepID=A0ABR7J755_9FLAO|nr:aldo/keto reductase [Flavobacterium kayseriense]MBC5841370.1 aldo/keto reductase [Flavobacterium kayseriense]MBC5847898.1 aldo/keto reductase [Flavobacterium kayseriense]